MRPHCAALLILGGLLALPSITGLLWTTATPSQIRLQYTGQYLGRIPSARTGMHAISADMDNDGDYDLVIASQESNSIIQIYLNNGSGAFTNSGRKFPYREDPEDCTDRGTGDPPGLQQNFGIVLRDFNRDGFLDVATADGCGGVNVYLTRIKERNRGGAPIPWTDVEHEWAQRFYKHEWFEVKGIAANDLDNDADVDLVFGIHNGSPDRGLRVYLNDGWGYFVDSAKTFPFAISWAIETADVNGDGSQDILAVYRYGGSFSHVFYNEDLNFSRRLDLPGTAQDDSYDVKAGDVNLDGLPDLVIAKSAAKTSTLSKLFLNFGAGDFRVSRDDLSCRNCEAKSAEMVDMDNDGWVDVLFGNHQFGTYLYLNDRAGGFGEPVVITDWLGEIHTSTTCVTDINNDGAVDLITGDLPTSQTDKRDYSGYRVYLNQSPSVRKNSDPLPPSRLSAEVQGNRISFSWSSGQDLETSEKGLTYNIRIGRAPNSHDVYSGTSGFEKGLLGHTNRYLLKNLRGGTYYWSVQTVDTGFRRSGWASEQVFSVPASADLTPPGKVTLYALTGAAAGEILLSWMAPGDDGDSGTAAAYDVRYSDGAISDGSWQRTPRVSGVPAPALAGTWQSVLVDGLEPGRRYYFALKTVDAAGNISAISNSPSAMAALKQGFFTAAASTFEATNTERVAFADLDGDGDLDLIEANGGEVEQPVVIYFNDSHGRFTRSEQAFPAIALRDVAVGDIDGDGDLDLITCGGSVGTTVWKNDGRGHFIAYQVISKPASAQAVKLADVDDDGDLDLLMASGGNTLVFLNDGQGRFVDSGQALGSRMSRALAVGDVDGDGYLDFVQGNAAFLDWPMENRVFLNDGQGRFKDSGQEIGSSDTQDLRLADVDGDGSLDLWVGNSHNAVSEVYLNDGKGGFRRRIPLGTAGNETKGVEIGDLNNDGYPDLVAGDWNGGVRIYANVAGRQVFPFGKALGPGRTNFVAVGDVDGDGDLDILSAVKGSPNVLWLNNTSGYQRNTPPVPPTALLSNVSEDTAYLSWDTGRDAETPEVFLTCNLRVGRTSGGNEVFSGAIPAGAGNVGHSFRRRILHLVPGAYFWSVQTIDSGFARSAWAKEVSFAVAEEAPGGPGINAVVNAASYAAGALAPGEIVTIFGKGLGPASAAGMQLTPDRRRVATTLAGTRVLFDGTPAPVLYASASQLSAVVPCLLAEKTTTQVQVEYLGVSSAPVPVPVARVRPGIFTLDASGQGPGAILNWPDQSVNRPGNAAFQGSIVSLYATSGGWCAPLAEDGRVADQALPLPLPVTATVGGLAVPVLYAGTAPTLVAGVLQVNLRIPPDAPLGYAVPVGIAVDGVGSQAGVTLAIRSASSASSVTLSSGYVPKVGAFKGQLHCHSTNSDGAQDPAAVVQAYKDAGYHFISITDHNYVTPDPSVSGILFILGVEQAPQGRDFNRVNARDVLSGTEQRVIDTTAAQGGFVFLNHPNWPQKGLPDNPPTWSDAQLQAVHGFHGVEVWNALVAPNSNAENRIDFLLALGRRLFLLATDDCHSVRAATCKTASTWVFADRLDTAGVMEGLKSGNFYASSGATISAVSVSGVTITVTTDRLSTIDFIAAPGRVAQTTSRTLAASYTVVGDEGYVRARITRGSDSAQAWTNPVYVER